MDLFGGNLHKILALKKRASKEKGQSLVEMTLGMVIMVFILSGVIDIGRAYFIYVALEDAAGEAALYMSTNPACPYDGTDGLTLLANATTGGTVLDTTTNPTCEPPDNALYRAFNAGGSAGQVNWTDATTTKVTISCKKSDGTPYAFCASATTGDSVYVAIEYQFKLLSPVIPNISGAPTLKLTGTASQIIVAAKK